MSPQFVDFDADGNLDIVAGTFSGSPWVALADGKGWKQPEQILDAEGKRIVLNQFWNYDTKKWDTTKRSDPQGAKLPEGHLTSAVAMDWEADGAPDLLLGDHKSGHVFLRRNTGKAGKLAFGSHNELVLADGKPIDVPGTVATLRLVDADRDGLLDLLVGSMGDAYQDQTGGGVYLFPNRGTKTAPAFAAPLVLLAPSPKGATGGPERPDSGIYADLADGDGDGDLDLVVGGYSHWKPAAPQLSTEQTAELARLRAEMQKVTKQDQELNAVVQKAVKGLEAEAMQKKWSEVYATQRKEREVLQRQRSDLQAKIEPLAPTAKREPFVWLYENTSARPKSAAK